GKSKFGKAIAKHFKVKFIDLDKYIELETKSSIQDIFDKAGEDKFRKIEHESLQKIISENNTIYICSTGGGTACFMNNIELLKSHGLVIYIDASEKILLNRLLQDAHKHRPMWRNKDENEIKKTLQALISRRKSYYEQAHITLPIVDNYKIDVKNLIGLIVKE
ncbi:MAG: shikimate kinase, partial [Bacteroidetes bacterium]|nr:shikimate kinase [Bacteroidota bacterium]